MLCRRSLWSYMCGYGDCLRCDIEPPAAPVVPLTCKMCCVFQDTFNGSASNKPFFTSVASITVLVKDIDNRPPWFQPCLRTSLGTAKLCVSTGYRGRVNLTEKEVGSCFIAYDPFLPRLILCVVKIDFYGAPPSPSTFVVTL